MRNPRQHGALDNPDLAEPTFKRHFFNLFGKKKRTNKYLRPGAMSTEKVREKIESIGSGKVIELTRIGFDGTPDEMPMTLELLDLHTESFSAKIINVERDIIEGSSDHLIYAKHGGGVLELRYDDGDIKLIEESHDVEDLEAARDVDALLEILGALEPDDEILVAYYDNKHHGTVNVEGTLVSADPEIKSFRMMIEKINHVELENHIAREFDVDVDLVIDISMV